jgi:threonine dehydrogenase-like Zn-dependent dehydrogenase
MRRLISMVTQERVDLTGLVTHEFRLEQLPAAFDLFSRQGEGVLKVGIYPAGLPAARNLLSEPAEVRG